MRLRRREAGDCRPDCLLGHLDAGRPGANTRFMTPRLAPPRSAHSRSADPHAADHHTADRRSAAERTLLGLQFGTAAAALAGGILLAVRPDGAFLHADPQVLRRTPFTDWRLPGLLLAAGCGGGYLVSALLTLRRHRAARPVAVAAGTALIVLEAWEVAFVEFQPLEAVFAGVGAAVVVLALRPSPAATRQVLSAAAGSRALGLPAAVRSRQGPSAWLHLRFRH